MNVNPVFSDLPEIILNFFVTTMLHQEMKHAPNVAVVFILSARFILDSDWIPNLHQDLANLVADSSCLLLVHCYAKCIPPFTLRTWPVMYPASSLARNTIATATSRAEPMRPSGMRVFNSSFTLSGSTSVIGVSMKPGATALTVILREAISMAMAFVRPMMPAFAAT